MWMRLTGDLRISLHKSVTSTARLSPDECGNPFVRHWLTEEIKEDIKMKHYFEKGTH